MPDVTITVPTALVTPLGKALARLMQEPEPTNTALRLDLMQRYLKQEAKAALLTYRAQEAGVASRADDSDGAVSW